MRSEAPLVSVVIPVYNVRSYLREALDSVTGQVYRELEIIIVDDGSTDGSGAICDGYRADPRVKVIHQENRGLSAARNAGLDRMTGEYVCFLDPDDAFHPEMIGRLLEALIAGEADMATCGYDVFDTEGRMGDAGRTERIIPCGKAVLTQEEIFSAMADGKYLMCVWNKVYKRRIWERLRYPEGRLYEDMWVAPGVVRQCERIAVVQRPLVYHRRRKGSITQAVTVDNIRERMDAQTKLWECLGARLPGRPEDFKENSIRALILLWAELKRNGTPDDILKDLKETILRRAGAGIRYRRPGSRAALWLFRFCPGMLLPARACLRTLKRLLGKERGAVA